MVPAHSNITLHESFSILDVCEGLVLAFSIIAKQPLAKADAANYILVRSINSNEFILEQVFL